jgi:hypothetical protein
MIFAATKNGRAKKFSPSSFGAVVGSGMDKNQDPGSGMNRKSSIERVFYS